MGTVARRSLLVFFLSVLLTACPAEPVVPPDSGPPPTDAPALCARNAECDDDLFCNGEETCAPEDRASDADGCLAGEPPCPDGTTCDEDADACEGPCATPDGDSDGHDATACGGDDCDDGDPNRYPGNVEICDATSHDEDCDARTFGVRDGDADGFADALCCNTDDAGAEACGEDCNDARRVTYPGNTEACDGFDNDCDGAIDEGVRTRFYRDADGDLHGAAGDPGMELCGPTGDHRASLADDCDDGAPTVYAGAPEICDMLDNDCDDVADDGAMPVPWYRDEDGDGFGDMSRSTISCVVVPGSVTLTSFDCDDTRRDARPGGTEVCDAVDNDCNGTADDGTATATCALPGVDVPECTAGACAIDSCAPGRGDCNGLAPDGCEADLTTSPSRCGSCTTACSDPHGVPVCGGGTCGVSSCFAGYHVCGGICVDDTSVASCGVRCTPCPAPLSDGTVACAAFNCRVQCASSDFVAIGEGTATPDCVWNRPELASLVPSVGALSPTFAGSMLRYTLRVPRPGTVTLTPTSLPGATQTIRVDGAPVVSGSASSPISVPPGSTVGVDVVVTAESGAARTYHVDLVRGFGSITRIASPMFEQFRRGIAIDGDTMVAAISASGGIGAIVYERGGGAWTETARLPVAFSNVGQVGISGNTIVVGQSPMSGFTTAIFVRSGTSWALQQTVMQPYESFAISGDRIVYGRVSSTGGAGSAFVYRRSGTTWSLETELAPSNGEMNDLFGWHVAISGDAIAVSAPGEDSAATGIGGDQASNAASASGAVYVYRRSGTTWSQEAYVKASNTQADDFFGASVALSGDRMIVSAPQEDSAARGIGGDQASNAAIEAGAVYTFARAGGVWAQTAYVKATNAEAGDRLGGVDALMAQRTSVGISDTFAVAGAWQEDSAALGVDGDESSNAAPDSGAVYVLSASGGSWLVDSYLKPTVASTFPEFGTSLAVSGSTIAVITTSAIFVYAP